jgi:hypothetical protein
MKRIREILNTDPVGVILTRDEMIFVTSQIICNVLDYVTDTEEFIKLTDLYIMSISYNSPLYSPWTKELFNKISFCQLMSYSGREEYRYFKITKKPDGLYINSL